MFLEFLCLKTSTSKKKYRIEIVLNAVFFIFKVNPYRECSLRTSSSSASSPGLYPECV